MYFKIVINRERKQQGNLQKDPDKDIFPSACILLDGEKAAKERKRELKELLIQTFKENHQVSVTVSLYSAVYSRKEKKLIRGETNIKLM